MKNTTSHIHLQDKIPIELKGARLDQALAKIFPEYSRAKLQTWIRAGKVLLDGHTLGQRDKVKGGEDIQIHAELEIVEEWSPEAIDLNILYEDDDILVINKPAGLVVHPAAGNRSGTLLNALLHHVPNLNQIPRAGIIHRLDKNTSGVLVVAKTLVAHTKLVRQLQKRAVTREYRAIVQGVMTAGGTIDAPIGRHPKLRQKMAVVEEGKEAITHYRVLERFRMHTYVKVFLETGRTHQIRVHMAYVNYPVVGDAVYNARVMIPKKASPLLQSALQNLRRQALHAFRLTLEHPTLLEEMSWEAPVPEDMEKLLEVLREDQK